MVKDVMFRGVGTDEDVILDYVARTGGYVVADWSNSPEPRRLDALGLEDVVWLVRTDDPDKVRLRPTDRGLWYVDYFGSYALQFSRSGLGPTGDLSEARVATESIASWTRNPGELAFIAWADRLLAHVKRAFPRRPGTNWRWGPVASSRSWPIGPGELGSLPPGLVRHVVGWPLEGEPARFDNERSGILSPDHQRPGAPCPEWLRLEWVSEETWRVAQIPLTLLGFAVGDIVQVEPIKGTWYDDVAIVERSGHATVQAAIDQVRAADASARIRELADRRGWRIEMWLWSLFAVDVPPGLDIDEVVRELEAIDGVRDIVPVVV